jgi:hypothetical protein
MDQFETEASEVQVVPRPHRRRIVFLHSRAIPLSCVRQQLRVLSKLDLSVLQGLQEIRRDHSFLGTVETPAPTTVLSRSRFEQNFQFPHLGDSLESVYLDNFHDLLLFYKRFECESSAPYVILHLLRPKRIYQLWGALQLGLGLVFYQKRGIRVFQLRDHKTISKVSGQAN